jgi:hypothetical protein
MTLRLPTKRSPTFTRRMHTPAAQRIRCRMKGPLLAILAWKTAKLSSISKDSTVFFIETASRESGK